MDQFVQASGHSTFHGIHHHIHLLFHYLHLLRHVQRANLQLGRTIGILLVTPIDSIAFLLVIPLLMVIRCYDPSVSHGLSISLTMCLKDLGHFPLAS